MDILIDTGSTCSVIKNSKMLLNIGDRGKKLRAYTNGGHQDSNEEGDLPGFFKVWYNPSSMLNILSFRDVRKRFRVTVDTSIENAICVHVDGGKVLKFVEVESGLYLLSSNKSSNNKKVSAYSYLTLVRANKDDFTNRQVKRADTARLFRKHLGYPGYRKYFKLLESNYFRNCPVTVDDAKRALHIYGPDIEGLKGNSVRKRPLPITELATVDIPDTLKDFHPTINFSANYFFIQGIAFLHTISRGYEFRTVECITDFRKRYDKSKMLKVIRKCINVYHSRNLRVTQLNVDNEFACIEDEIRPTRMNVVAAGEHVGDIERSNRTVQEGTRRLIHTNPYERYPRIMVKGCAIKSVKNLNRLPSTMEFHLHSAQVR